MKHFSQFCLAVALCSVLAACGGGGAKPDTTPMTDASSASGGPANSAPANSVTSTNSTTPSTTSSTSPTKIIPIVVGCPDAEPAAVSGGGLTLVESKVGSTPTEVEIPMVSICIPPDAREGDPDPKDPVQVEALPSTYLQAGDSQVTPIEGIVLAADQSLRINLVETRSTLDEANALAGRLVIWYLSLNASESYDAQALPTTTVVSALADGSYQVRFTASVLGNGYYLLNTLGRPGATLN